ncbi:adhesive domain-containing protein, partial [Lactococcus lactis]
TAQASEVDVTLASKTKLDSTYGSPINTTGSHMGTLTVTNNIGAQANILLQTLKSAEIKIPAELANNIKFDDNADVSVQMGINITKIPVLGDLFNSLATGTDKAIKKQLAILVNNPALGGSKLDKVYDALNALETFQNMDMSKQVSSITVKDGVATAKFDDSTARYIANKIITLLDNLQTAINMVDWGNSVLGRIANTITSSVKPAINFGIDSLRNIINGSANFASLLGNAGIFTSSTIKFPVDLDLPMSWFEQYAPNGLTTNFTAGIENTSGISWDIFKNTADANKDVVFADIVAPATPVLSNVKKSSVTVKAEAGSTVTVYNASGAKIGSAKVPGTADGKTQASVNVNFTEQKADAKISVKAADASGNTSAAATATIPGDPTPDPDKTQVVYRVYNPNTGEHFYPTSAYERDQVVNAGWRNEGILETAPTSGRAIYRVYNPNAKGGDHYYTTSQYEAKSLVSKGWKWDNNAKPVFYSGGSKPVYVAYNPNAETGAHNYTMSAYEQNSLLSMGWKYGETAWFAVK